MKNLKTQMEKIVPDVIDLQDFLERVSPEKWDEVVSWCDDKQQFEKLVCITAYIAIREGHPNKFKASHLEQLTYEFSVMLGVWRLKNQGHIKIVGRVTLLENKSVFSFTEEGRNYAEAKFGTPI